ncbi:hypothetical protein K439DRAFT_1660687 [Ramaria rubella]|nr:hypothetical protein K439DRAFT_1660687 [Ramaria rubella]
MEAVRSTPASNCHILTNSPALHSLKRQQLVQLCKRNGIKANGKNSEMVEKLKAHAMNHSFDPSPLGGQSFFSSDDEGDKENKRVTISRPSEAWTVIEEDSREIERVHLGLKDIREEVDHEMSNFSTMRSFGTLGSAEFGNGTTSSKGSSMTSSIKAFATSLKRGGSKMSTEPTPSVNLSKHAEEPVINDMLAATSTPYHAHPITYPSLPSPVRLDADDSQDQSMLDLGASTIRLVTTAPLAPSPPALRPFTPNFEPTYSPDTSSIPSSYPPLPTNEDSHLPLPGAFPGTFGTPSNPSKLSTPVTQPFLFGSPAHQISNTQFNSAAASVLAEMNARLGLTGTSNAVGLDLLQNRRAGDQPAPLFSGNGRTKTDVTNKFDKAHEREFQKMEGLGEWYARRNAASPGKSDSQGAEVGRKRKSDALGGPHRKAIGPSNPRARRSSRVVTTGTRRSLVAAAEAEDANERRTKRVRISVVEGGDSTKAGPAEAENQKDFSMDADEEKDKTNEEKEKERAAIKKRLEISRARRRSSMGRVSVGGGKPPLIPNQPKKGTATRFGFLSSAKSLVKSVWKGVGTSAPKPSSTLPAPKPATAPNIKKSTPSVLTKPNPATNVPKPSIAKLNSNTSLHVPVGRKSSIRSGMDLTGGTRSSIASSGSRSRTMSSSSGLVPARRPPIPPFPQHLGRVSRTGSLTSTGGTLGTRNSSSTGTGSSRGAASTSSIGVKKPAVSSSIRSSDAGSGSTNTGVRKRTSTLFAPTASSLAKMQSNVRPPSLSGAAAALPGSINTGSKALAKVAEAESPVRSAIPSFTFTSPLPVGGVSTPSRATGSIFTSGIPTVSPSHAHAPPSVTAAPKPRVLSQRRPRISRSRVIAKVGAQRAASGSSLASTSSGRRSLNAPKTRGSLGVRVSGIGGKGIARDAAAQSARKKLRQSEILRRRSKLSGISPALLDREDTPESREEIAMEEDGTRGDVTPSVDDVSMASTEGNSV